MQSWLSNPLFLLDDIYWISAPEEILEMMEEASEDSDSDFEMDKRVIEIETTVDDLAEYRDLLQSIADEAG